MPTYVIDSCCVISLLIRDHDERIPHLERLFEDGDSGAFNLILPTVARLEILGNVPQRASSGYPPRRRREFDRAREWMEARNFEIAELDDHTVRTAHELIRDNGLGGIDAGIIATGLAWGASKVLTYDGPMLNANDHIQGLSIEKPSGSLWDPDLFNVPD